MPREIPTEKERKDNLSEQLHRFGRLYHLGGYSNLIRLLSEMIWITTDELEEFKKKTRQNQINKPKLPLSVKKFHQVLRKSDLKDRDELEKLLKSYTDEQIKFFAPWYDIHKLFKNYWHDYEKA